MQGEGWLIQQTDFFIGQKVRFQLHTPQPLAVLHCMLSGHITGTLQGCGRIVLKANESTFLYLSPAGRNWVDLGEGYFQSIHIEFSPDFLSPFITEDMRLKDIYYKLQHKIPEGSQIPPCTLSPRVLEQIEKIRRCDQKGINQQLYCQTRIHDTLFLYFKALREAGCTTASYKQHAIRELAVYINENLSEPLTVTALAQLAGMNHFGLLKEFKKVFQQPPVEYIRSQRIKKAACLIKDTHLSITHIALAVGFTDLAYFSRVFKQYFGCAPSEYRERKTI
jgi:AraC-like DNA-binding protein